MTVDQTFQNGVISGSVSGFVQVLTGHPLDTIKVHLQTTGIYKKGIKHLYRGMGYPFAATIPTIALQFGIENTVNKTIKIENNFIKSFVSGACTGFLMSPIMSIVELYKIRRQTFTTSKFPLSLGMIATCMREIPNVSLYFGIYNYASYKLDDIDYFPRSFISGGIAGGSSWFFFYPFDVIKSRIQQGECNSIREAFLKGQLWKGVGICTLRGIIVNAFGFLALETSKIYIN